METENKTDDKPKEDLPRKVQLQLGEVLEKMATRIYNLEVEMSKLRKKPRIIAP